MRSYITLAGTRYSGTNGPTNVQMTAGDTLSWLADYSAVAGGFEICGSTGLAPLAPPFVLSPPSPSPPPPAGASPPPPDPLPPPTPAPAVPPGHLLYVVSTTTTGGQPDCYVSGNGLCVTDGPGNHGNGERCTFAPAQTVYVTATSFATESYWEYAPQLMCSNSGRDGHAR